MELRRTNTIRASSRRRGFTFVEVLIAGMLMSLSLLAVIHLWCFSLTVTSDNNDKATAYNIGRGRMETVKMSGFAGAAEGVTTTYYTLNQVAQATADSTSRYRAVVSIVSSSVKSGVAGQAGAAPADLARRTVTVNVIRQGDNTTLYTTGTYLVRAGI